MAIEDTGIGIAAPNVSRVFEVFGQVDGSTTRKHEGDGAGRSAKQTPGRVARRAHVAGERGGAWHHVLLYAAHLPAAEADYATPGTFFHTHPPTARRVILVHEPDPLLLRTLRRQLGGYE